MIITVIPSSATNSYTAYSEIELYVIPPFSERGYFTNSPLKRK